MVRLAPLHLFRAFEAAAKHVSFTAAAEELCVTQSAVSQQVRQLEDHLGVRLFRRLPRRLELTREGLVLAGSVHEALFMLRRACERLSQPTSLTVSATPSLAARWLVPRLKGYMDRHADVTVSLLASDDAVDFDRQDIDVALRWGRPRRPAVRADPLPPDPVFPVCSPALVGALGVPAGPRDLERFTLLETANSLPWVDWCEAAGFNGFSFRSRLYFSDVNLMLEAASQSQGVCLTSYLMAEQDLRAGRLTALLDARVTTGERIHVLTPSGAPEKPAVTAFRAWIMAEAERSVSGFPEFDRHAPGGSAPAALYSS